MSNNNALACAARDSIQSWNMPGSEMSDSVPVSVCPSSSTGLFRPMVLEYRYLSPPYPSMTSQSRQLFSNKLFVIVTSPAIAKTVPSKS